MVYVLLAPGFEESEAVVPTGLETALVSLSGPTVSGSHGITLCADLELSQVDLSNAEMLVLPGGLGGVEALWADDRVSALIQEAAGKGVWLAALCAAPILLGRWGLLDGRKATSYPTRHGQLGKAEVLPEARIRREVRHRPCLRLRLRLRPEAGGGPPGRGGRPCCQRCHLLPPLRIRPPCAARCG